MNLDYASPFENNRAEVRVVSSRVDQGVCVC